MIHFATHRKRPLLPGPPAGPTLASARAFILHEVVDEADVELVEPRLVDRQSDRNVLGCTDQ